MYHISVQNLFGVVLVICCALQRDVVDLASSQRPFGMENMCDSCSPWRFFVDNVISCKSHINEKTRETTLATTTRRTRRKCFKKKEKNKRDTVRWDSDRECKEHGIPLLTIEMFRGKNWSERTGFAGSFSNWVCYFPLGPLPSKPCWGLQCHVPITTKLLWLFPTSIEKTGQPQHSLTHLILKKISNIPKPEAIPFELTEEWRKGSCRATVYLSLINHDSVYNGPSTARHCFSQGLEDQPPRYPRGQTVKGSQTLVTFHQMGWRNVKKWSEHAWAANISRGSPTKTWAAVSNQNISKSIKIALHNSEMFIVIVTMLLFCASAVSLSPWSFAQVERIHRYHRAGPATQQSSFICRKTSPRWSEPWGKVLISRSTSRAKHQRHTSSAARGITTDRMPWRAA